MSNVSIRKNIHTNNKYERLRDNTLLMAINTIGSKCIPFLLVPLYTSVLSTSEYGTADFYRTMTLVLAPILSLDIYSAVLRFGLDDNYENGKVFYVGILFNGLAAVLSTVLCFVLNIFFHIEKEYVFLIGLLIILRSCYESSSNYIKSTQNMSAYVISSLSCTLIIGLGNVILLVLFDLGIAGYLLADCLGLFTGTLIQTFAGKYFRISNIKKDSSYIKEMVSYSAPLIANEIAFWIISVSDRAFIMAMIGEAANGIYTVAYKVPAVCSSLQNIFNGAWTISAVTEYDKNNSDVFFGKIYDLISLFSFSVCSLLILLNIPIAKILYNGDFFIAYKYVPLLLFGTCLNGLAAFHGSILTARKEASAIAKSTVLGCALNLFCNFIFIYFFGIMGAVFATCISYVLVYLYRCFYIMKRVSMDFSYTKHFIIICLLLLQSGIATYIPSFWIIEIAIIILSFFLQRRIILEVIKQLKSRIIKL